MRRRQDTTSRYRWHKRWKSCRHFANSAGTRHFRRVGGCTPNRWAASLVCMRIRCSTSGHSISIFWRANRLVVDTGMHALGWTRQEAIDWMKSNSPITEVDVVAEVERYIAIPSQALAYKIGQMKIRELRTRAEEALGDAFDVRNFTIRYLLRGRYPCSYSRRKSTAGSPSRIPRGRVTNSHKLQRPATQ